MCHKYIQYDDNYNYKNLHLSGLSQVKSDFNKYKMAQRDKITIDTWSQYSPLKNLLLLEVSALLNVKAVDGTDFWVWSNGVISIGVGGGGSGGGVGGIDESNDSTGDAGADFGDDEDDFNRGSIGAEFNAKNVGADFDVGNFGADSDADNVGIDFDAGSSDKSAGGEAGSSGTTSSITSRGGECTSTMLCCVLNFPFDREILSAEEVLDLLLSLMVPLYELMSVKQFCIN